MGSSGASVNFEKLGVSLGSSVILDEVTASVPAGGCTAIIGPNGAGKTTLLLALLGEYRFKGEIRIRVNGNARPKVAYVPQRLAFDRALPLTVMEFMTMGRQWLPFWLGMRESFRSRAHELLVMVKAEALAERRVGALSGGELQRVLLALALQEEPDLLVLDEVSAGVDVHGESLFCEILETLRAQNSFTQLMVSHDLATVTHHATHVICLNRKVIAEGPPSLVLTRETLRAVFGIHMGLIDPSSMPEGGEIVCSSCMSKKHA